MIPVIWCLCRLGTRPLEQGDTRNFDDVGVDCDKTEVPHLPEVLNGSTEYGREKIGQDKTRRSRKARNRIGNSVKL